MKRVSVLAALALALCVGVPSVAAAPSKAAATVVHASAAPGVTVVSFTSTKLGDGAFIQGEARNGYLVPVSFVQLLVSAYDSAGKVVASQKLPLSPAILDPGETAPFMVGLDKGGARYTVTVASFRPETRAPNRNFTVTHGAPTVDEDGALHLTGTVRNDNTTPSAISLFLTYRDAAGTAVGMTLTLVDDLHDVAPGASASFEFEDLIPPEFASFDILADGISDPTTGVAIDPVFSTATVGSTTKLTGTAKPGEAVTFQQYGASGWADIAGMTATADATTGAFTASYKVAGPAYVRAVAPSATSPGVGIVVAASATFKTTAASAKKGAKVTLSGAVKPGAAGTVVTIQRKVGSKWTTLATAKLSASGAFTYAWVPKAAGTYVLRASVPAVGLIQAGVSATKTVKVK